MAQSIKFNQDFFESGAVKYAAGSRYPVTEETSRQIAMGIAEEVSIKSTNILPDPVESNEQANADTPAAEPATADGNVPQPAAEQV